MSAVVFDLDDTIVNTDFLRGFRDAKNWGAITDHEISKVRAFDGIPELFSLLRSYGCKIAVVTTAPKWYAEKILAFLGLAVDALVASGDAKWGKPDRAPTKLALELMGESDSSRNFVVGDRCIDIASGRLDCDWTIGAKWATPNFRDLALSYPKFMASTPAEVGEIVSQVLAGTPPEEFAWGKLIKSSGWMEAPSWDYRHHLSSAGIPYRFMRMYHGGGGSWTGDRIRIFKTKNSNQWRYKAQAASTFAHELCSTIPEGSWILFVTPSSPRGTPGFDNRWDLIAQALTPHCAAKDWKICQAIEQTVASTPAHEQSADSPDREPAVIRQRLAWVGGIPADAKDITVIDDVITKGGHLRAYYDLLREMFPSARIHVVAWAVFSSTPWHQCPSRHLA